MPDACFCEAIRGEGIRQPANSFSSLAFVVAAIAILAYAGRRNLDRTNASLFAATLAFVGIGSAYYHATLTFTGQFFDVLGMYLIATLALVLSLSTLRAMSARRVVSLYVMINLILAGVLYYAPALRRWIFAALLFAVIVAETIVNRVDRRRLLQAIAIMLVAFIIWALDFMRIVCSPSSPIQGHAAWHVLGALAGWLLYLHYQNNVSRIRK